jgi:hypothetical protein
VKWEMGRQGTGYRKLPLFQSKKLSCDAWLIDYPPDTHIPTHTDPVSGKKHFRLNILLWGQDNFRGKTIFSSKRIKLFRPDISPHSVERVASRRIIFSIGWAR